MPTYTFEVRTRLGRSEKGTLEAPSSDDALSILHARELVVISLNEVRSPEQRKALRRRRIYHRVKKQDMVVFARSLAAMVEAGLPLVRALEIIADQSRSQRMQSVVGEIVRDIRAGSTLRDAMAKHPKIFSPFWVSLVETGEASGQLAKALDQIATYLEKSGSVRRKVISALIYPAILVVAAGGAIAVFVLKIIPQFETLYLGLGGKLPGLTLFILNLSRIGRKFLLLWVGVGIGVVFLVRWYVKTPQGRWQFDSLKLKAPVVGEMFQCIAAQEFASNLGTLLKAGVPILYAMEIVISGCGNKVVAATLDEMRTGVREGRPIAEQLSRSEILPPMVAQMIAVGEQTGKLTSMLDEVSKYYEEQVDTTVGRLMTLLEPVLLIGMAVVIGILVISMYLPVLQLSSSVGTGS